MIQTRQDECSEANVEHEHSPHCEDQEEQPECDFLSKYRFVFFQILPSKLICGMSMIVFLLYRHYVCRSHDPTLGIWQRFYEKSFPSLLYF